MLESSENDVTRIDIRDTVDVLDGALTLLCNLLALVRDPTPLPLFLKPRLQPHYLRYCFINNPLRTIDDVSMPPRSVSALGFERTAPVLKPIHEGGDGLWGQPISWQWNIGR